MNIRLIACVFFATIVYQVSGRERYQSTFAFLNIKSSLTPDEGVRHCINYNPSIHLPTSIDDAAMMSFSWLNDEKNISRRLIPCKYPAKEFTSNSLVPIIYDTSEAFCSKSANITVAEKFALELSALIESGVSNVLYLVKKGGSNMYGFHDYLFAHFVNIAVSNNLAEMSAFYMYHDTFSEVLKYIDNSNSTEFRVYRPQGPSLDISVLIVWSLAFFCVTLGGICTAYETWTGLNKRKIECERAEIQGRDPDVSNSAPHSRSPNLAISVNSSNEAGEGKDGLSVSNPPSNSDNATNSSVKPSKKKKKKAESDELAELNGCSQCCVVICFSIFIVAILMISYTFRTHAITLFNILCLIMGGPYVHHCIYGLIQFIFSPRRSLGAHDFDIELFSLSQMFCMHKYVNIEDGDDRRLVEELANSSLFSKKFRLLSSLLYCFCVIFTIYWYCTRTETYAFLMLDFINICVCIQLIKGSYCYTLRFLTFLLMAMFVYDIFMVFGTRLLTPSGCSVMVQVATGVDCSPRTRDVSNHTFISTIAPIESKKSTEQIPFIFSVPALSDPLRECYEIAVEKNFEMLMLGLGDIIFPGYLISYCFHVDVLRRHRFFTFGIVSLIGYCFGLFSTFIALQFMQTAQPALIYLVPFTLVPILLLSWKKGIFRMMWLGRNLMSEEVEKDTRITINS